MYTTGEKPGKGTYKCIASGTIVVLDDDTDTLPPCPSCDGTKFIKIGKWMSMAEKLFFCHTLTKKEIITLLY